MSIGQNIKNLRKANNLTQDQLAEELDISFQAVSSWERDEYKPETDKLIRLAEIFDVSVSSIVEEKQDSFKTKKAIYNWEHMKTFVKVSAKANKLSNTLKAVDFALKAHEGQKRKRSSIPYIYHPLNLACHALSMNIVEDEIVAACLLHDVVEDCDVNADALPVNDEVKELVLLLTKEDSTDENRDKVLNAYYKKIGKNPKAALIKCLDRCNNLTTMSWGLSREKIFRMIKETEKYYPGLLDVVKATPEYNNAAFLLTYHMESMLDIYKRLL